MILHPINDQITIALDRTDKETEGGIVLTESKSSQAEEGTVLEVGSGHLTQQGTRVPLRVKPGDRVLVRRGGLEYDTNKVVVQEAHVLGKVAG